MKRIVELVGDNPNGRKMIAWGRRIGCADAGHGFDPASRKVVTKLLVDDSVPSRHSYLLELVDNPAGLLAIDPAFGPAMRRPADPTNKDSNAGA